MPRSANRQAKNNRRLRAYAASLKSQLEVQTFARQRAEGEVYATLNRVRDRELSLEKVYETLRHRDRTLDRPLVRLAVRVYGALDRLLSNRATKE